MKFDKNTLIKNLNNELTNAGFYRKSNTWYYDEYDLLKVVNLQKSNFTNLYYVNLGIYLKEIGNNDLYPKEQQCHIRTRLNSEIVESNVDYNYLFDLEKIDIDEEKYIKQIKDCVNENVIPQLDIIKSKQGILNLAKKMPSILNLLPLKVKVYFQI